MARIVPLSEAENRGASDNHPMNSPRLWDIFCAVIDNHGDLGVCWRLARQLAEAGQSVRLWVDDDSALRWMVPQESLARQQGVQVLPWADASDIVKLASLPPADVWIEAFGCTLPETFVAHGVATHTHRPTWINLEYLSAENWVPRMHGLPSPVMSGPAKGWTKHFFYPGFTPDTGGLLRESDLLTRQQAFDRSAWRQKHAPKLASGGLLVSLFCYEPTALHQLLTQLVGTPHHLLVTPGRPLAAVHKALANMRDQPSWSALPYTNQNGFDDMLWACDLNFVRGEDSLVRALWAAQAFIWHIYPQDDNAHHAKLTAFLDWLQAPQSLRHFHRVWNGVQEGQLPDLTPKDLQAWRHCAQAAKARLLTQDGLMQQLMSFATHST
jgi:uncharacterized repeat protein (TIGR03837 family)